jgi:nicotinamidase-related amidase
MFAGENAVWAKVFAALIIVVMTVVNIVGSKLVANAQTVIVFIVLGILTFFAVVTLANINLSLLAPSGYPPLRDFLKKHDIRHVLLVGYATDMCYCKTTAGYENLSRDFNVFLVGDATLATFPANSTPRFATNAHISFASLDHLITQVNWVTAAK